MSSSPGSVRQGPARHSNSGGCGQSRGIKAEGTVVKERGGKGWGESQYLGILERHAPRVSDGERDVAADGKIDQRVRRLRTICPLALGAMVSQAPAGIASSHPSPPWLPFASRPQKAVRRARGSETPPPAGRDPSGEASERASGHLGLDASVRGLAGLSRDLLFFFEPKHPFPWWLPRAAHPGLVLD